MREGLRNPVCGMEEVGRRCGEKGGLVVVVERDDDMSREGAGDRRVSSSESRSVDGMSAERTQIPRRLGADVSSKCLRLNMININCHCVRLQTNGITVYGIRSQNSAKS